MSRGIWIQMEDSSHRNDFLPTFLSLLVISKRIARQAHVDSQAQSLPNHPIETMPFRERS